jgi:thymidylate synthase ThyX
MSEGELIDLGNEQKMSVKDYLELGERFYRGVRKAGHKPDSARQFLWIGTESQEVETTNFREWRHIFGLRTAKPAHWEIRSVMNKLLEEVKGIVPVVFDDFEVRGKCPMGVDFYECKVRDD